MYIPNIKYQHNILLTHPSAGDLLAAEWAHQEALKIDPLNIKTLTLFAVFLHRKKGKNVFIIVICIYSYELFDSYGAEFDV
jgi:hypothetical protein